MQLGGVAVSVLSNRPITCVQRVQVSNLLQLYVVSTCYIYDALSNGKGRVNFVNLFLKCLVIQSCMIMLSRTINITSAA